MQRFVVLLLAVLLGVSTSVPAREVAVAQEEVLPEDEIVMPLPWPMGEPQLPPGWTVPERPARPEVPGLGESAKPPTGAPVSLSLLPGWRLAGIRGGSSRGFEERCFMYDPAAPPAECLFARGPFQVTLVFERTGTADDAADFVAATVAAQTDDDLAPLVPEEPPLAPLVPDEPPLAPLVPEDIPLAPLDACAALPRWAGWVLQSNGDGQNIWVPVWTCIAKDGNYTILKDTPRTVGDAGPTTEMRIAAAGPNRVELTVGGYCINASRSAPSEEHGYSLGVISDDPVLERVAGTLKGKDLSDLFKGIEIQSAIWSHTDGDGITDEEWAFLSALK